MSSISSRMKRMVVFNAENKQKKIISNISEPQIMYSSIEEIDAKFEAMSEKNKKRLFNFEMKQTQPNAQKQSHLRKLLSSSQNGVQSKTKNTFASVTTITSPKNKGDHFKVRFEEEGNKNKNVKNQQPHHHKQISLSSFTNLQTTTSLPQSKHQYRHSFGQISQLNLGDQQHKQQQSSQVPLVSPGIESSKGNKILRSDTIYSKDKKEETETDDLISSSPEWLTIQKNLKDKIKMKKSANGDEKFINPIVKLFGNTFIAMVLQALVVKKIDDLYGVKINTDSNIPISENLLKQFGISMTMLNSLSGAQEKNNYIAETMSLRISLLIKEWDSKQKLRYENLNREIKDLERQQQKKDEINEDMFDWLIIGNNHNMLQKKLKSSIIERLTEFENQDEIKLKMKNDGNITSKNGEDNTKISLKNLPNVSTRVLLLRMNELENKYLKEKLSDEQLKQYQETQHDDFLKDSKNKSSKKIKKLQDDDQSNQEWTPELEKEFLHNKKQAKIFYGDDIAVSSWNKQAYVPLFHLFNSRDQKQKMQREHLTESYLNGCWLTERELKFIGDTSKLMNSCINKDYVQKIVNKIDKRDIEQLELGLAENIINNYENMQRLLRDLRLQFLEQKQSERLAEKVLNFRQTLIKNRKQEELSSQRRYVRIFKTIGERLLSTKRAFIFDTFKRNFYCKLFFEKMRESVAEIRKRKLEHHLKDFETHEQKLEIQLANQKSFVDKIAKPSGKLGFIKGHDLHPPSKLPFFHHQKEEKEEVVIDKDSQALMQFMVNRYHLTTRSKPQIRIKENFTKFYTGGPLKESIPVTQKEMQNFKITSAQYAGIVRIQTLFRQYRMKKIIRQLKEQDFANKRYIYRERLLNYMQSKRFLRIIKQGPRLDIFKYLKQQQQSTEKRVETLHIQDNDPKSLKIQFKSNQLHKNGPSQPYLLNDSYKVQIHPSNLQKFNIVENESTKEQPFYKISEDIDSKSGDHNGMTETKSCYEENSSQIISVDREYVKINQLEENKSNRKTSSVSSFKQEPSLMKAMGSQMSYALTAESSIQAIEEFDKYPQESSDKKRHSKDKFMNMTKPFYFNEKSTVMQADNSVQQTIKSQDGSNIVIRINPPHSQLKNSKSFLSVVQQATSQNKVSNQQQKSGFMLEKFSYSAKKEKVLLKHQKLLHYAQTNNFLQLLNSGFQFNKNDIECKDSLGNTPLFYAIDNQNVTFVRWLLSQGANMLTPCDGGQTPLHQAFLRNQLDIIYDLLIMNPNLEIRNQEGKTPQDYASNEAMQRFKLSNQEDKEDSSEMKTNKEIKQIKVKQSLGKMCLSLRIQSEQQQEQNTLDSMR